MSNKKIRRLHKGPPPRAGWAIDSVLTRNGNIDVRRLYIGPKNVDPEDMVNLMSAVVAASINTAFLDLDDRGDVRDRFMELVASRIDTAVEEVVSDEKDAAEEPG